MLVVCAGMFRSGSTWQYQVACDLIRRSGHPIRPMGYMEGTQVTEFLAGHLDTSTYYIFKTHPGGSVYESLDPASIRVLYSYRDLRDVAYSMAYKLGGLNILEEFKNLRILEQSLAADAFWRKMPNVLIQRYEDWIEDNAPFVSLISQTLGLDLPAATISEVTENFGLSSNRSRADKLASRLKDEGIDLSDRANSLLYDPDSLLHWNHLRSGVVGSWQAIATTDEKLFLVKCCGDWLVENGYEPDHSWAINMSRAGSKGGA